MVAFEPDLQAFRSVLESLCRQYDRVALVDNSHRPVTAQIAFQCGVEYIYSGGNVGLAAALNAGIAQLRPAPDDVVSCFDQDTEPAANYLSVLLDFMRRHPAWPRVVAQGSHFSPGRPNLAKGSTDDAHRLLTSGLTLSSQSLSDIGPFREDFFVDVVDFEFSARARRAGYTLAVCETADMTHGFGDASRRRRSWLLRTATSGHGRRRHYWIGRNSTLLCADPEVRRLRPPVVTSSELFRWWLGEVTSGRDGIRNGMAMLRGVLDAHQGVSAPLIYRFEASSEP
ncbi:glycosyltransferase [Aquipuribacter nitratireducens]|uniref:Glycosyltransferase n=1 Tax=Aquipuribacter nitratireducens TaxID=650104 RepID=A0ABW0GQK8_9MICO